MNVLPKVYIGITFVQIECNLVIICYKVNLLYIIPPILILESNFWYFLILLRLECWKLYKTICQGVMEAEKLIKQKYASNWMKPHYSPFQIWCSHYIFVNYVSNFIQRINILLFLDSAKAGLLKNVQNQFSRCFGSREMSKTKAGTFFWNAPIYGSIQ